MNSEEHVTIWIGRHKDDKENFDADDDVDLNKDGDNEGKNKCKKECSESKVWIDKLKVNWLWNHVAETRVTCESNIRLSNSGCRSNHFDFGCTVDRVETTFCCGCPGDRLSGSGSATGTPEVCFVAAIFVVQVQTHWSVFNFGIGFWVDGFAFVRRIWSLVRKSEPRCRMAEWAGA